MTMENKTMNPTINNGLTNQSLELSEETLIILQEFLTVLQSTSIITEDIVNKKVEDLSKLFYNNYELYYERYKNKVCDKDLDLYERLATFICMSNLKLKDIRKYKEIETSPYIADSNQFSSYGWGECRYNVNVGIEYKLCYKNESYVGVIDSEKYKTNLSAAHAELFIPKTLSQISDGVIKVKRFKEGSYLRFRFMINIDSIDEIRNLVRLIVANKVFKTWKFKGICDEVDILKIRYLYELNERLGYGEGLDELECMDVITYNCMNFIRSKCYSHSLSSLSHMSSVFKGVRKFLIDLCLEHYIPEKDKELFYKLMNYTTYVTFGYSMMGYAGMTEKSLSKMKLINENIQKMARLISKVLYDKSLSSSEDTLLLNGYAVSGVFGVKDKKDIDMVVKTILETESYKNFNVEDALNDESYLANVEDKTPFEDIGISEETAYLVAMAVKALYRIPEIGLRNSKSENLVKRAKRFINKDEYEIFGELVKRLTTVENGVLRYVPQEYARIMALVYKSKESYFEKDDYIRKSEVYNGRLRIGDGQDSYNYRVYNGNNIDNALVEIKNEIQEKGAISGGVIRKENVSIENCYIVLKPSISIFKNISTKSALPSECKVRNIEMANIFKYALEQ